LPAIPWEDRAVAMIQSAGQEAYDTAYDTAGREGYAPTLAGSSFRISVVNALASPKSMSVFSR